ALAMDIRRYLADEPVLASPPSAGYRFRKFARRNKGVLVTTSAVAAALLVGTAVASWQALVATGAAEAERQAKSDAEAREAETRAVLEFVEKKIFAAARPEGEEGGLGHDVPMRTAVESALMFVEASFEGKPLIEARLRMTLGTSFLDLGDPETAAKQFQTAH